ncbi:type II toxin-antitoxin system prevent-host-death family antitoxin [Paracoccus sp. Z118]|uniref:type II toxin-antitoxin system Phd/YefM family antitoxin n=1 Tax=Paracoccus sp. Z118 TaxID=2851017 RepID=UPI001C2C32A8|nr:type II toxin-antitoxin system prevent-host-death family antitoxin [Paracoccus sp. Z118]MBV0891366.1 type II toxin-antitoxin system prevent-host-death family antitoxin [Paracoccus sp. Z118]
MKTVNMHEAKTHLSKLVEGVENGEPFIIARAGKPVVKVTLVEQPAPRRTGFLKGKVDIPEDFDDMFADEIQAMFEGKYDGSGLYVPPDQRKPEDTH